MLRIGSPVFDIMAPTRTGELVSIAGTFVVARTAEGKRIYILRDNAKLGRKPRGPYRKPEPEARDPETLRLALACGLPYHEARKVRGT